MQVIKNVNLAKYHTFGCDEQAKVLIKVQTQAELKQIYRKYGKHFVVLGKGSNTLFTHPIELPVIKLCFSNIDFLRESARHIYISTDAGCDWQDLVDLCLENNWAGIENLTSIPGTVGAAPVQNINAYGAQVSTLITQVEVFDSDTGGFKVLSNKECKFSYRNSMFKTSPQVIITKVWFKLTKPAFYHTNVTYKDLVRIQNLSKPPTIRQVYNEVNRVRRFKLPSIREVGTAGSFFKNPTIDTKTLTSLAAKYPDIQYYPSQIPNTVKLYAAWLIEFAGWKSLTKHHQVKVHSTQALVITAPKGLHGKKIMELVKAIQKDIFEKFNILLEPEVKIY